MGLSTTYTKAETNYLLQKLQEGLASGIKGNIKITDVAPTVQGLYILSDVGTYANLGGLVTTTGKTNYAYFDGTTWSLIAVAMPNITFSTALNSSSVDKAETGKSIVDFLTQNELLERGLNNQQQIRPLPFIKYTASNAVDSLTKMGWYVGKSTKKINRISIPLTADYDGTKGFTDSVFVRIGLNGTIIYSEEITLAKMASQGIDAQVGTENKSMYTIDIPEFTINNNDIIWVGMMCKSTTDKLGFAATNSLSNEWVNGYNNMSSTNINTLTNAPAVPSSNGVWAFNIYFDYYSETFKKPETGKGYFDKQLNRNIIGEFLSKLRHKDEVKVVCYGDSITQFQNSGTLPDEQQKINPIGLSANSWVRQLWTSLKYYGDDTQYRRFDHSDFTFSNGIQTTSAVIGTNGWATNRNDAESWRNEGVNTIFAQSITASSKYNKPIVGTNKLNEQFSISIPSTATYVDILFIRPTLGNSVEIKINNGTTDIVSENSVLNTDNQKPTEFVKRFEFPSGTSKTISVKNTGGGLLWFWGVAYGSTKKVRVINSGSGGYNVNLLEQNSIFNPQVSFYNPDLVVYECNILNDKFLSMTLSGHLEKIKSLFNKLKALNVPVIVMLTHRGINAYKIDRTAHSEAVQNSIEFLPELIKNYKAEAHANGFAIIDIWAKSIDLLGTTDAGNGTSLFLDDAHLNSAGNTMYFEELHKLFVNEDF